MMRVLVLGEDVTVQRLTWALAIDGIEVESLAPVPSLNLESIEWRQYDLVVIDSYNQDVKMVSDYIFDLNHCPVCLILCEKVNDWKMISALKVDCFMMREAGDRELRARVRAICRRQQLVKLNEAR